jgi:hypothetical protein
MKGTTIFAEFSGKAISLVGAMELQTEWNGKSRMARFLIMEVSARQHCIYRVGSYGCFWFC